MTPHDIASVSSGAVQFNPLQERDLPMLREWLLRPHVAAWWGPAESIDDLRGDYLDGIEQPGATRAFIANLASRPIGFIQCYVVMGSGGGWRAWTVRR